MTDAPLRFVAHPLTVIADILGEARRASEMRVQITRGIDRRQADELRRDFNERLSDQHRYGIEVRAVSRQPEPLRL